jgi:PleD family two-component response regulator
LCLLYQDGTLDEFLNTAESIRQGVNDMDLSGILGPTDVRLTVSIGIAVKGIDGFGAVELTGRAHETTFVAREDGGNRIYMAAEHPGKEDGS